ncbi:PepSY domain-containing protein [Planococcus shixiaomingii]|uniref:PepSY domain-containing protein n=1 Tax=Planococcus shixiaomingii TaxID=3058393 RepID=UPI002613F393|nr:PepSY domain-containing protein [Planococcus sp. N022]WKA53694.1 PepSY domain-containing protein [Planococcus sp. N022]
MKKKTIYVATTAGVLAFGGMVFANTDSVDNETTTAPKQATAVGSQSTAKVSEDFLSFDEISKKALEIADGTITDIEFDDYQNKHHYDVEIYHNGYEYDLKLDAASGEVLEQKREKEDDEDDVEKALATEGLIASDKAIEAALTVAKGTVTEVSLDEDDGVISYEIELKDGKTEHEVSVDALDGSILEHESDDDDKDDD